MSYTIDYSKELNPSQYQAVFADHGPYLVIAGAGSGKTRTLTYRVARLVEDNVDAKAILLLTFTRKASKEMLHRATKLLDNRCMTVSGGTFHSFAAYILRRYASKLDYSSDFVILDKSDSDTIIETLRKEHKLTSKERRFPRKSTVSSIFSKTVNQSKSLEKVLEDDFPQFLHELNPLTTLMKEYTHIKKVQNLMDYDDLLVLCQKLLATQSDIRQKVSSFYQYIMVDEYQDTNLIQSDIVKLLAEHQNVMVVGDDSQSIYAFRGANFKNIMQFPEQFPGTTIIKLEENYRSLQPILSLTNTMIEQAKERYTKELFSTRKKGPKPSLIMANDEKTQSVFVLDMIKKFKQKQKIPLNDMAVLFRASFHSYDLETVIQGEGIPYVKYGGFKFMEKTHIKDFIAYLKIFHNPTDRLSWHRILSQLDHVGIKTAEKICSTILSYNDGYKGLFLYKTKSKYSDQIDQLKKLYHVLEQLSPNFKEMGQVILNFYTPIVKSRFDDYPQRIKDLEKFLEIMDQYKTLNDFFTAMALEPPNDTVNNEFDNGLDSSDKLVLSTIHSAKGLEWRIVFIIWTLDGRFPTHFSLNNRDELEEELRLMYVAATRAKDRLFFICPSVYDPRFDEYLCEPSRFIKNLSKDLLSVRFIDSEN